MTSAPGARTPRPSLGLWLLVLALAHFVWTNARDFLVDPPVWPDEALFASPALDLLAGGPLRTTVLEQLLEGAEVGTYYVPPAYPVAVAAGFALFGVGVSTMRALSLCCALVMLWLSFTSARRLGLARAQALWAPTLVALDPVFARAAHVGRMDLFALTCAAGAVVAGLGARASDSAGRAAVSGALAGLALSFHPMCAPAALVALGISGLGLGARRRVTVALAAFLMSLAPWALWIARAPDVFAAQWQAQLLRKAANWRNYGPAPWEHALDFIRSQFPPLLASAWPVLQLLALVPAALCARARPAWAALAALHVTFALAAVRAAEMWYALYLVPGFALLIACGLAARDSVSRWPRTSRAAAALGAAVFVATTAPSSLLVGPAPSGQTYAAFAAEVVAALPVGARVLIAAVPDPYFATLARPDLDVREFLPSGIPLGAKRAEALTSALDFVVIGHAPPSMWVQTLLEQRGRLVRTVGDPGHTHYAQIYTLAE